MPADVLVVDDSMSARFALTRSLEPHGLNIETAKNAEEALDTVQNKQFDLIFMDHVLPGMNGLEATEKIRELSTYANTPIIMCSSNDGQDYIDEALQRGATDVIIKPPEPTALARVMETYLSPNSEGTSEEPAPEAVEEPISAMDSHENETASNSPTEPMNDSQQLAELDARIERMEKLLERLETTVSQMDARTNAMAKAVAEKAGRDLSNRLLRAVITLKGGK